MVPSLHFTVPWVGVGARVSPVFSCVSCGNFTNYTLSTVVANLRMNTQACKSGTSVHGLQHEAGHPLLALRLSRRPLEIRSLPASANQPVDFQREAGNRPLPKRQDHACESEAAITRKEYPTNQCSLAKSSSKTDEAIIVIQGAGASTEKPGRKATRSVPADASVTRG